MTIRDSELAENLQKASSWLLPLEFMTSGGEAYLLPELDIGLNQYSTLEFEFAGSEASECDDSQFIAEHRQ